VVDPDLKERLSHVTLFPGASICEALARLDQVGTGALILSEVDRALHGLLTDGDIRRAVLRGVSLEDSCGTIANRNPVTARDSISARDALHLMTQHDINHLPLVDEQGVVQALLLRKDLGADDDLYECGRQRLDSVVVSPDVPLSKAILRLDQAGTGAVVLCESSRRLHGLLTDGDVRRAVLRGVSLDEPCGLVANRDPVTARDSISARDAVRLMTQHDIDHLPVVDAEGNLLEFLLLRDLIQEGPLNLSAVIMAGGFGTRLLPLTEQVPKPMLPVGNRPLLERTIQQLRRCGIREVHLTTHYLPEAIVEHFGDGAAFGVTLAYSNEDRPLGTAGGLKRVNMTDGPFVVINGDILTGVSFQDMLLYHRKYGADMTVGVRKFELDVPFGVVECEDVWIRQLREKPTLALFINAGIYLLEPSVRDYIPDGVRFDMTDLVKRLLDEGRPVAGFPIIEYWQDVGRHEDYQQAQEDARNGRI
jgi:dTDP-glucose pyrophosphorylase/CBS-domain-containing membrane protein